MTLNRIYIILITSHIKKYVLGLSKIFIIFYSDYRTDLIRLCSVYIVQ